MGQSPRAIGHDIPGPEGPCYLGQCSPGNMAMSSPPNSVILAGPQVRFADMHVQPLNQFFGYCRSGSESSLYPGNSYARSRYDRGYNSTPQSGMDADPVV